jgi:hypothetical protein
MIISIAAFIWYVFFDIDFGSYTALIVIGYLELVVEVAMTVILCVRIL